MKILLLGAKGQLAKTLSQTKPKNTNLISLSRSEFDFLDLKESIKYIDDIKPSHIINAAAYTNVDKAESEKDLAEKILEVLDLSQEKKDLVGSNARTRVKQNFNINSMLDKTLNLYEELLQKK